MKDILIKARELLQDESKWIKGALGRDNDGAKCDAASIKSASCFCLEGAIYRAKEDLAQSLEFYNINDLFQRTNDTSFSIFQWNDRKTRTHSEVLTALDNMINYLDEKEKNSNQKRDSTES